MPRVNEHLHSAGGKQVKVLHQPHWRSTVEWFILTDGKDSCPLDGSIVDHETAKKEAEAYCCSGRTVIVNKLVPVARAKPVGSVWESLE